MPIDRTEKNYPDASAYGFQVRARRSVDFPYNVVDLVLSLGSSSVFSCPFSKSNRTKRTMVSYLATRTVGAERRRRDATDGRRGLAAPAQREQQRNRGSRFPHYVETP